jgi:hypothetical protein
LLILDSFRRAGFSGFVTVNELQRTKAEAAPEARGVYMILRTDTEPPVFLERSPAGRFKDKDPTVSVAELTSNWVEGTLVLYIGRAGSSDSKVTLRSRLRTYLRFGAGRRAPHYGGRLIWQVAGSASFIVCWKTTPNENPRDVERVLIERFKEEHEGRHPFADLQD